MSSALNKGPAWHLSDPTFLAWEKAFNWAWHVARTSGKKCKVTKVQGRWRVWRLQ